MEALYTILSMLAVWRATFMLQEDEGPFGIFSRLQAWIANRPDKVGGLNHGYFCFYCLSIWVSVPFAIFLSYNIISCIIYILALSAGAVIINMITNKLEQ